MGELQIKCDYVQRGCRDPVQLGNLEDHVSNCGFAPVACEKCGMQLNRKDKDNHEKNFCQLGATKCQECVNIKANQDEMRKSQTGMMDILETVLENQDTSTTLEGQFAHSLDELKRKHDEMGVRHLTIFLSFRPVRW